MRHVLDEQRLINEQRGRHDRQRGVLGARGANIAVERRAALDT